jgi:hypothetical protein
MATHGRSEGSGPPACVRLGDYTARGVAKTYSFLQQFAECTGTTVLLPSS